MGDPACEELIGGKQIAGFIQQYGVSENPIRIEEP